MLRLHGQQQSKVISAANALLFSCAASPGLQCCPCLPAGKIGKQIAQAVRQGGPDQVANARLREALAAAKMAQASPLCCAANGVEGCWCLAGLHANRGIIVAAGCRLVGRCRCPRDQSSAQCHAC